MSSCPNGKAKELDTYKAVQLCVSGSMLAYNSVRAEGLRPSEPSSGQSVKYISSPAARPRSIARGSNRVGSTSGMMFHNGGHPMTTFRNREDTWLSFRMGPGEPGESGEIIRQSAGNRHTDTDKEYHVFSGKSAQ